MLDAVWLFVELGNNAVELLSAAGELSCKEELLFGFCKGPWVKKQPHFSLRPRNWVVLLIPSALLTGRSSHAPSI